MIDLNTTYGSGSVTSQTGAAPGTPGQGGSGSFNMSGFGDVLNQLAARRAWEKQQAILMEQRRLADQEAKQRAEQNMAEERWQAEQNATHAAAQEHAQDRNQRMIDSRQGPAPVERWMKYLPGIGPVEVAPGTFGAYAAGNVDQPTDARAHAVGLTPGVVGQNLGYFTAGQTVGGKTPQPTDPFNQMREANEAGAK